MGKVASMADIIDGVMYSESDSDISTRDRGYRVFTALLSIALVTILPALVAGLIFSLIPLRGTFLLGAIVGAMFGHYHFARFVPRYFVTAQQATMFVTLNPLLGYFGIRGNPNRIYGPGGGLALPWETRSPRSNLSLQVITLPWTENVPGATSELRVTGTYQFKVHLPEGDKFVGVDESSVRGGLIRMIQGKVSGRLANKEVDDAKAEIDPLSTELGRDFGVGGGAITPEVARFHGQFGIRSVRITVSGVDLPPDVQRSRDANDELTQTANGVARLLSIDLPELKRRLGNAPTEADHISLADYMALMDRALIQQGAGTNIQLNRIAGVDVGQIITAITQAITGGGTTGGRP